MCVGQAMYWPCFECRLILVTWGHACWRGSIDLVCCKACIASIIMCGHVCVCVQQLARGLPLHVLILQHEIAQSTERVSHSDSPIQDRHWSIWQWEKRQGEWQWLLGYIFASWLDLAGTTSFALLTMQSSELCFAHLRFYPHKIYSGNFGHLWPGFDHHKSNFWKVCRTNSNRFDCQTCMLEPFVTHNIWWLENLGLLEAFESLECESLMQSISSTIKLVLYWR